MSSRAVDPDRVAAVAASLVPIEFLGLQGLEDMNVLQDATRFTERLVAGGDPGVVAPLRLVAVALDGLARARHRRRWLELEESSRRALWLHVRDLPGFAQLRQVVRTSALVRIAEWEGFRGATL